MRLRTLLSLAVVAATGFGAKFYRGPGAHWINDSVGGIFYCVLWCLVVLFLFPRWHPRLIAGGVLAATCILEFTQLSRAPFLELIRSNFIGRTIIGSTFDWLDFPYYVLGSGLGWWFAVMLQSAAGRPSE